MSVTLTAPEQPGSYEPGNSFRAQGLSRTLQGTCSGGVLATQAAILLQPGYLPGRMTVLYLTMLWWVIGTAGAAWLIRAAPRRLYRFFDHVATFGKDIPELVTAAETIDGWREEITGAILAGITNAAADGINRLTKLIYRVAFGFRNVANQLTRARYGEGLPRRVGSRRSRQSRLQAGQRSWMTSKRRGSSRFCAGRVQTRWVSSSSCGPGGWSGT